MALPTNMTALTPLLTQLAHKRVAHIVMALLLIYIAYVAAQITWFVVPQSQPQHNATANNVQHSGKINQGKKTFDVSNILSLHLFGKYTEEVVEESEVEMSNVPETNLNLTLSGLVASDDETIAAAIIEHQGKQETYGIGDVIIGTRANLEQVLMDRVLIKQSGRLETLMLDGFDYNEPARKVVNKSQNKSPREDNARQSRSDVVDQRTNQVLTDSAKSLRNELATDPAKIGDYLRISPKRKDGKIIGYSLRPGKKPEFFKLAGLKAGDVAVQMNGFDLIEPTQAMQAMAEMKQASDISLLVDRQGSMTEILISLN